MIRTVYSASIIMAGTWSLKRHVLINTSGMNIFMRYVLDFSHKVCDELDMSHEEESFKDLLYDSGLFNSPNCDAIP